MIFEGRSSSFLEYSHAGVGWWDDSDGFLEFEFGSEAGGGKEKLDRG